MTSSKIHQAFLEEPERHSWTFIRMLKEIMGFPSGSTCIPQDVLKDPERISLSILNSVSLRIIEDVMRAIQKFTRKLKTREDIFRDTLLRVQRQILFGNDLLSMEMK